MVCAYPFEGLDEMVGSTRLSIGAHVAGIVAAATSRAISTANGFIVHNENNMKGLRLDRKSTRLNSSHSGESRMPSSA